ncbi:hypothetical protein [Xanthovirga aplysinae]|uniref:hypothetical protein n=1 Tax=Xanthovirga aplysinae TaxID=2529853 RepID=UPI001CA3FD46|nr:hypothetical protein [Xanthovirga aplysinae]
MAQDVSLQWWVDIVAVTCPVTAFGFGRVVNTLQPEWIVTLRRRMGRDNPTGGLM